MFKKLRKRFNNKAYIEGQRDLLNAVICRFQETRRLPTDNIVDQSFDEAYDQFINYMATEITQNDRSLRY